MITQEMIDRINELYHKSQGPGLSTEEKEEQQMLRRAYIEASSGQYAGEPEQYLHTGGRRVGDRSGEEVWRN